MAKNKLQLFERRRQRVRSKLRRVGGSKPRLSVHRSLKNISVQLIDDVQGRTLAAASTLEQGLGFVGRNNLEAATRIGAAIAERARALGVEEVFFDRGGFIYHGKIKALADAARAGGLKF